MTNSWAVLGEDLCIFEYAMFLFSPHPKTNCNLRTLRHYGKFGQNLSKNSRGVFFAMICHFYIPMALKSIKNPIRTEKGHQRFVKANIKAREPKIWKCNNFSLCLGPFGVNYNGNSVFWSFKVIKAKKAATVAINSNLHSSASNYPKVLL